MVNSLIRVIAFDPGEITGIAKYADKLITTEHIKIDLMAIEKCVLDFKPDIVVIEEFKLYPSKAKHLVWNQMYPAQVIGVIKLAAKKLDVPVIMQAATIKKFSTTEGCPKDSNIHEKDAYMHLWFYMKKQKLI
jgi:hypothetical protein